MRDLFIIGLHTMESEVVFFFFVSFDLGGTINCHILQNHFLHTIIYTNIFLDIISL